MGSLGSEGESKCEAGISRVILIFACATDNCMDEIFILWGKFFEGSEIKNILRKD